MVTEKSSFSLRMPPQVREAADALVRIMLEPVPGQITDGVYCPDTRSALLYLIKTGMRGALVHIDHELAKHEQADAVFRELVDFFLKHPAAAHVTAANFPEGSEAHKFVEHEIWEFIDDCGGPEPPRTAACECYLGYNGEWGDNIGLPREAATEWLTNNQRDIFKLTAAKGAIQKALSFRE
jgi:hypothetical protein